MFGYNGVLTWTYERSCQNKFTILKDVIAYHTPYPHLVR